MRQEHYMTEFWNRTHPMSEKGQKIMDAYLDGSDPVPNAPRGTKGKLNRLAALSHRHYRFYNDGDSFSYKGESVGMSTSKRYSHGRNYYNVTHDNKMLKLMENEMAELIEELWVMTDGATK